MKPVQTRRVRQALRARGCIVVGSEGSHEKWATPGGLTDTIVAGEKEQSPGVLGHLQRIFAPELGEKWLEKELRR